MLYLLFLCAQDILKDYLDKRERGDLLCQKKVAITEFINAKVTE